MDKDYLDFTLDESESPLPHDVALRHQQIVANATDATMPFIHLVNRVATNPKLYASRYLTLLQRQRDE